MVSIVGIDPGINGGLALLDGKDWAMLDDIPKTNHPFKPNAKIVSVFELETIFREYKVYGVNGVIIEAVHAMPNDGVVQANSFGLSTGIIIALAMSILDAPIQYVSPNKWKRALGLNSDKRKSLKAAHILYPSSKSHLKLVKDTDKAEALLMAHYASQLHIFQKQQREN